MATQPTQDAVPSESPRNLKYNAGKIDEFTTSLAGQYTDRFGNNHYTIEGLKQLVLQHIYNLGWNLRGTFQGGGTVTSAGDLLQDTATNIWYRWDDLDSLPKTVPAGSTPASAGGTGVGKWQPVDVADVLRQDLAKVTGATLVNTDDGRNVQQRITELTTWSLANDSASYRSRNLSKLSSVQFAIRNKRALRVLCQGDSITAGYDVTSTDTVAPEQGDWARHADTTYPERFRSFMTEQSGCAIEVSIRAISGYTAKQAYEEPLWQSAPSPACDLAFLMYGINDSNGAGGATHDEYMANMEKMIRRFINWGIGVVVLTAAVGGNGTGNTQKYQIWTEQVKNMAHVYGCAHFDAHEVQYYRAFGSVQSDNSHFNSIGYSRLAECLTSMLLAGGLLETYQPVNSELLFWPGRQDSHIGFANPDGLVDLQWYSSSYSFQGSAGVLPAGKASVMSFAFYQDCEALELDVTGRWRDNEITVYISNHFTGNVSYYPYSYPMSFDRNSPVLSVPGGMLAEKSGNQLAAVRRNIGSLIGRGWKIVTFATKNDGSGLEAAYIQLLSLRPVNLDFANRDRKGIQHGIMESYSLQLPDAAASAGTIPGAATLGMLVFPMPKALQPRLLASSTSWFDSGLARMTIVCNNGTQGVSRGEWLITKSPTQDDVYSVTALNTTAGSWPAFTAKRISKSNVVNVAAGSVSTGMPQRDISTSLSNDTDYPLTGAVTTRTRNGMYLQVTADWSGVSGGAKNGFYFIEIQSAAPGAGSTTPSALI